MHISILSREQMADLIGKHKRMPGSLLKKYKIISIFDNDGPLFKEESENLLSLDFHDVTPGWGYGGYRLFNKEQARLVVDFLCRLEPDDNLIVHCRAGISRSGAVGTFAAMLHGESLELLNRRHPTIYPNEWVLDLLAEAYREKQAETGAPAVC
jgi:predicted protein tyrosine phosphatase